jgi:hypothetical protein
MAFDVDCGGCAMSERENMAIALASNKRQLERRLRESVSCLINELRALFRGARFCFKTKRLISVCGKHALEYRIRLNPDLPESYQNQQTTRGCVVYVALS